MMGITLASSNLIELNFSSPGRVIVLSDPGPAAIESRYQ